MQKYIDAFKRLPSRVKMIIFIVFFVLIAGLLLYTFINMINKPKNDSLIKINNYSADSKIPENYRYIIEQRLSSILQADNNMTGIRLSEGAIRDGSYKETTNSDGTHVATYILDIDSLHYSISVRAKWSDNNDHNDEDPDIEISCPYYTDYKYTDTKCIVESPTQQVKRYLPHYGRVNGKKYAVSFVDDKTDAHYLKVEVPACGGSELFDLALNDVKQWLKSVYLDPNDYEIEVKNVCRE